MDLFTLFVVIVIVALLYYEKRRNAWPSEGHGLTGVSQDYFLRISYLTQSLRESQRKHILEEFYHTIKEYQRAYSPEGRDFLQVLFSDEYKDSARIDCLALSFILCDRLRSYGPDELGHKMADAYYSEIKRQLGELYDYCHINNIYFPGEFVDCFCSDGYYILKEYSQYFMQNRSK